MNVIEEVKIPDKVDVLTQIRTALDGRSQRWLAQKTGLTEPNLSNKMNGFGDFKVSELKKIASALNITIII